jgi:hypothetical protein
MKDNKISRKTTSKKKEKANGRRYSSLKRVLHSSWSISSNAIAKSALARRWRDSNYSPQSRIRRRSSKELSSVPSERRLSPRKISNVVRNMEFA